MSSLPKSSTLPFASSTYIRQQMQQKDAKGPELALYPSKKSIMQQILSSTQAASSKRPLVAYDAGFDRSLEEPGRRPRFHDVSA
jgi:hypothetical protein